MFKRQDPIPSIHPTDVAERIAAGALLIDVREQLEWDKSRITGAEFKPLSQVNAWYEQLPRDRDIILYCQSGQRSAQLTTALTGQVGMTNIYNLTGGIKAWSASGLALES